MLWGWHLIASQEELVHRAAQCTGLRTRPLHPLLPSRPHSTLLWRRPGLALEMASMPHHWPQEGICQTNADLSDRVRWSMFPYTIQGKVPALQPSPKTCSHPSLSPAGWSVFLSTSPRSVDWSQRAPNVHYTFLLLLSLPEILIPSSPSSSFSLPFPNLQTLYEALSSILGHLASDSCSCHCWQRWQNASSIPRPGTVLSASSRIISLIDTPILCGKHCFLGKWLQLQLD